MDNGRSPSGQALALRVGSIFVVPPLRASILNAVDQLRRRWKYRKTWGTPVGRDCISLDASLCAWLATRLRFLAEHHHSFPSESSSEAWAAELRAHADTFAAYSTRWGADTVEAEEALIVAAQESLRWVADMLPTLWD